MKKKIVYPTLEEVVTTNKKVLEIHRAKKADKHDVLSYQKISDVIKKVKSKRGNIYSKAAVLLKELTLAHAFASGNRRTAFTVTANFIYKNDKTFLTKKDKKENFEIFKKIRYRQTTEEEILKWLKEKE